MSPKTNRERDGSGQVRLLERPGLGITPDLEAAKRYLVETEICVGGKTLYQTPELRH